MSTPPVGLPDNPPAPGEPVRVSASASAPDVIELPTGKEMDDLAVAKLRGEKLVQLMVLAGTVGVGKTTLLTSFLDLFQDGKIGDYSFAWSKTLPAFERRCHYSRTASERAIQDTERTPFGDVRYLHVQVSGPELRTDPLDLIFTDVSGETFERARDSISECKQLHFLRTADHFLLLIDCEKLVDLKKRNRAIHDAMTLLRSCLDSGMLGNSCFVNVLWTKYDWIEAAGNADNSSFLAQATEEFRTQFGSRVGKLSFTKVAARPEKVDTMEFGYGIAKLLKEWANDFPRDREMNLVPDARAGSRESEKFLERHFKSVREGQ
jgi:Double-GTPase 2